MRVRFNKDANNILNSSNIYMNEEEAKKNIGKWKKTFENENDIYLEIGIGKGDFIVGMAKKYPNINFIGIEKNETILAIALNKIITEGLENVIVISNNADQLKEVFEESEIDKIFLNFSDPWSKKKHVKRRLTYSSFLDIYEYILKDDGNIEFKTDNQILFEFTIMEVCNTNRIMEYISLDLHSTDCTDNVMTEYERKFSERGNRIYKLVWKNK